jgi:hypothetical protein
MTSLPELPTFHFISFCQPATASRGRSEGFYELSMEQSCHRPQLLRDIAGTQFEDIDKVYEAADGKFHDVTLETAEDVLALVIADGGDVPDELRLWLQEVIGVNAVDQALAEQLMEHV